LWSHRAEFPSNIADTISFQTTIFGHFCCKIAAPRHADGTLVAFSRHHFAESAAGLPAVSTFLERPVD
jgi:hypothetical protein